MAREPKPKKTTEAPALSGAYQIVVLDRGFVYVGDCLVEGDTLVIREARNLRRWRTSRGLGQLALEGPRPDTVTDPCGTVRAPLRALIHTLDTERSLWI